MATRKNVLVDKAARTADGTSEMLFGFGDVDELRVQLDVDAVSGTSPSLTVVIEDSVDGGVSWNAIDTFPAATVAGVTVRNPTTLFSDVLRVSWSITGTTPSVTFGVTAYAE